MKKILHSFMFVLLVLLSVCSGCGTITRGLTQTVHINSSPTGAYVSIDGSPKGTTPVSIDLARRKDHSLKFSKPGYDDARFTIRHKFVSSSLTGNLLLGGIIGIGVDALSGAAYDLVPETVLVTLEPQNEFTIRSSEVEESPPNFTAE